MQDLSLRPEQLAVARFQDHPHLTLRGPAGTGKSTAAAARLRGLLTAGVPADEILILIPQRTLADPFLQVLHAPDRPPGGVPTIQTLGGLAQRMTRLFWPLAAAQAGFANPTRPPVFLTLETAQYFIAALVGPLLDEGVFEGVKLERSRLYAQILDTMNKAAVVGFGLDEIGPRLTASALIEKNQEHIFADTQRCAVLFRQFCLAHNLLDFSLQFEMFTRYLWPSFLVRQYLNRRFRHLIYDNAEEDVPVAHDILLQWLPDFDTSMVVIDEDGGYRLFLGADPASAERLAAAEREMLHFQESLRPCPPLTAFAEGITASLNHQVIPAVPVDARARAHFLSYRFAPELAEGVSVEIARLIQEGVPPGDIAVLSPFLSDSLRFTLVSQFERLGIAVRTHRPSRSLRDEPAARALITFARLAHPTWGSWPSPEAFRAMLITFLEDCDLPRADLLTQICFPKKPGEGIRSFDQIQPAMQNRITFMLGERYERMRSWLQTYLNEPEEELDVFFSRLFGELLSQPGYRLHTNLDSAAVTARLIESIQKFRRVYQEVGGFSEPTGKAYIRLMDEGVLAAQYLEAPDLSESADAVLISPAYTFLMSNRSARVQFWLDSGSRGWFERLYQPLTHPYILSRRWQPDMQWTYLEEDRANRETLGRVVRGLLRRCSERVYIVSLEVDEQGREERGPLLRASQAVLRKLIQAEAGRG